jgi:hypothetical protein
MLLVQFASESFREVMCVNSVTNHRPVRSKSRCPVLFTRDLSGFILFNPLNLFGWPREVCVFWFLEKDSSSERWESGNPVF